MKKLLLVAAFALVSVQAFAAEKINPVAVASASLSASSSFVEPVAAPHFTYDVTCVGADGAVRWHERSSNTVTTQGKADLLNKYMKAGTGPTWYLGLKGTGSIVVGDTAASHAGWAEVTPYTGNRTAITWPADTSTNSLTANQVSYAITLAGPTTVAGAFVQSVNTGTTGVLYSATDFGASRSVVSGDTLNVTLTVTD